MSRATLAVVQFPHPGPERPCARLGPMDWVVGSHARKFLMSPGTALRPDGTPRPEEELVFWGEWDAPSVAVERLAGRRRGLPQWLHEPRLADQPDRGSQNVDPFVFGERFWYSNCRQLQNGGLQRLVPGSLILFGSSPREGFVLDTVLVVGDAGQRYDRLAALDGELGTAALRQVTLRGVGTSDEADQPHTLYRGRMHADGAGEPYSFIPCLPRADAPDGFARPVIDLAGVDPDVVNPRLRMQARISQRSPEQLRVVFDAVVGQVAAAGLLQGVRLADPLPR